MRSPLTCRHRAGGRLLAPVLLLGAGLLLLVGVPGLTQEGLAEQGLAEEGLAQQRLAQQAPQQAPRQLPQQSPPASAPAPAPGGGSASEPPVAVPGFWDPRRRPERPDLGRVNVIRFMTETDYPPFNFAGPDGNPQGFNIDLARALCDELKLGCTVQMRRFETLIPALNENRGDAAIASIAVTPEMRAKVDFSDPYYRTPGRFAARRDGPIDDPLPEKLEGKKVAVVAGTAHEAYLKALFTEAELRPYPNADVARLALRRGDVDFLFGDAISLAFWLNGTDSENCCSFRGGPYLDSRYFGEGVGIAVRKGNDTIRLALNYALFRLWEQGRFTDLWLRYFPISPF